MGDSCVTMGNVGLGMFLTLIGVYKGYQNVIHFLCMFTLVLNYDSRSPTWVKWKILRHIWRKSELHSAVLSNSIEIHRTITKCIMWDDGIMQDGRQSYWKNAKISGAGWISGASILGSQLIDSLQ